MEIKDDVNQNKGMVIAQSEIFFCFIGFPVAYPMRFCLKKSFGYKLITELQANYVAPVSTDSARSCVKSRTILASLPVTSDGLVYCDVYNATNNRGCSSHMTSTSASFTVQDFPGIDV